MASPGLYGFSDYALLTPTFVPMNPANGVTVASPSANATVAPNLMDRLAFPSPSYSPGSTRGAFLPSGFPPLLVTGHSEVERLKKKNAELTKRLAQLEKEHSREHCREQNTEREEDARLEELSKENKGLIREKQLQEQHLFATTGQKLQSALFYNDLLKTSPQQLEYLLQKSKQQAAEDTPHIVPSSAFVPAPYRDDASEEDGIEDTKIAEDRF